MSDTTSAIGPCKGLIPYSEEDALFFFGRTVEQQIITANLMASRFTLLYGASGVGKSSVLRAGVANHLRQLARRNLAEQGEPEFAVVVFSSWRDDPVVALMNRVQDSVKQALNGQDFVPVPLSRSLADTFQAWSQRVGGDLLIILDQFEEYFLYHADEDGEGTFAVELERIANRTDLRVNLLVSIREDALAKLDRFKGRIPGLFDNYLRVEHLDLDAARDAIEKPLKRYNDLEAADSQHVSIEPALTNKVLDEVRTGRVIVGEAARGVPTYRTTPIVTRVETPYLQLVMTRLWDEEMHAGSRVLCLETLNRLGGAERIIRTHLDGVMDKMTEAEREIAAAVFYYLVTGSGTKIAHTAPDLADYAQISAGELISVVKTLEKLSTAEFRILRPVEPAPQRPDVPRYEIFHDVLAPAILDWRRRYLEARELVARKRVLRRRFAVIIGLLLLGTAGLLAVVGSGVATLVAPLRIAGWSLLPSGTEEEPGFGLYSYLLISSPPESAPTRALYTAVVTALSTNAISTSAALSYVPPTNINLLLIPVVGTPVKDVSPDWILQHYDYARAAVWLASVSGDSLRRGTIYVVSARAPLGNRDASPRIMMDLSSVSVNLVDAWVRVFLSQTAKEESWVSNAKERLVLQIANTVTILSRAWHGGPR